MFDRRQFLTGFAAFAFAPSGGSGEFVWVGEAFTRNSPYSFPSLAALQASPLAQGWRCHSHYFWERTLCHDPSGVMFATSRDNPYAIWLVRPADAVAVPAFTPTLFRMAHIALYMRFEASTGIYRGVYGRDRVYFVKFMPDADTCELEAAPPLPYVTRYAA